MNKRILVTLIISIIIISIIFSLYANSDIRFKILQEIGIKNKPKIMDDSYSLNLVSGGIPSPYYISVIGNDIFFNERFTGNLYVITDGNFNKEPILNVSTDNSATKIHGIASYESSIFLHLTEANGTNFLTGVATDSHRLSSSSVEISNANDFVSIILPRKAVFQLCTLLSETQNEVAMQISDNKIKFSIGKIKLVSKVIDGKFPDYKKVVPTDNKKYLIVNTKDLINSIERVATVSLDRKEGVKLNINKDKVQLSVNSANSGEGNEIIKAEYNSDNLNISFNSKYLVDIASEVENNKFKMHLKDSVSPVLIEDLSDKNSYYVIMPMKI
mgnify:CR=1 FL=1